MRCDMKAFVEDGKVMVKDEQWITIGGEDNDGSGKHVLINGEGTIVAGFGKGKNVKNAFGEKKGKVSKATTEMKGGKFKNLTAQKKELQQKANFAEKWVDKSEQEIKERYNKANRQLRKLDKNNPNNKDEIERLKYERSEARKDRDAVMPELRNHASREKWRAEQAKKEEDIAKKALEKYRAKKADTPEKANEFVAKKKVNISKFNGAPTIEQLKKAEHGGGYSKYQRVHRALGEKEFLSQEGKKPLKNAHFRKTSEENKAFNREYDKESAKAKKKIDSAQAEIDKLNAQYRNSKGTPDSPELERDREQNYRAELKKLVKKRDSARRAWINKEDDLYEKYGQYGDSRYDRQEVEAASRKALKRFRSRGKK